MSNRIPMLSGRYVIKGVMKDKPQSMKDSWKIILSYLKKYRFLFVLSMIFVALESVLTAVAPEFISKMTDLIADGLYTGDIDLQSVSFNGIIVFCLYLFGTIAMYLRNYWMSDISQYVANSIRHELFAKLERMPMRFYDNCRKGDVISRFTNDADIIGTALNRSIAVFVHGVVLFIICIVMMLYTNITLSIVAMVTAVIGTIASIIIVKYTQKYYRAQQANIGNMYGLISEMYSAHDIVMAYSAAEINKKHFDEINESLMVSGFRSEITMGILPAVMKFIGNLGYVAVCIIGSMMVIEGQITIGVVVAFILYTRMFMGPLDMIAGSLGNIQAAGAGAERVKEFLESDEMEPEKDTIKPEEIRGRVEFRDVHFGYLEGQETIRGFSAIVEPGQKIAIVGETGAGKTTIANLLMRFYELDSGDILIDGVPIRDISRDSLHDVFCMVLQDSWIFDGTIRENILYRSEASDERLREVLEQVGLDRFVDSLPDGIDTRIDSAKSLSEGQKQQICIARAMVEDDPILILDEATSSVDTLTEVMIQRAIDHMMTGRTSFVIAHRLSTIKDADMILVMKDGNIVQKGTHEELLHVSGVYSDLYKSQFENSYS